MNKLLLFLCLVVPLMAQPIHPNSQKFFQAVFSAVTETGVTKMKFMMERMLNEDTQDMMINKMFSEMDPEDNGMEKRQVVMFIKTMILGTIEVEVDHDILLDFVDVIMDLVDTDGNGRLSKFEFKTKWIPLIENVVYPRVLMKYQQLTEL
jgi:Ca2+-binding EF-hand superfamily protein